MITVDDVIKTFDTNGLEATRLLHFSLVSNQEQKSVATVAVHLHHSTRTIQVQGSHMMPDSSRAALWFVNNTIITRFNDQAKAKNYSINRFNEAALRMSKKAETSNNDNLQNVCQACHTIFNTQSKPCCCNNCSKYFHKTCYKEHSKHCNSASVTAKSSLNLPSLC